MTVFAEVDENTSVCVLTEGVLMIANDLQHKTCELVYIVALFSLTDDEGCTVYLGYLGDGTLEVLSDMYLIKTDFKPSQAGYQTAVDFLANLHARYPYLTVLDLVRE